MLPFVADVVRRNCLRPNDGNDPVDLFNGVTDFLQEGAPAAFHGLAIPPHPETGLFKRAMQPLDKRLIVRASIGDEDARLFSGPFAFRHCQTLTVDKVIIYITICRFGRLGEMSNILTFEDHPKNRLGTK